MTWSGCWIRNRPAREGSTDGGSTWLRLDLDEDAGGDDESVQRLDGARVRLGDVDDPLMSTNLELLTRLLVDEG